MNMLEHSLASVDLPFTGSFELNSFSSFSAQPKFSIPPKGGLLILTTILKAAKHFTNQSLV
jgi:hypothetical protein